MAIGMEPGTTEGPFEVRFEGKLGGGDEAD